MQAPVLLEQRCPSVCPSVILWWYSIKTNKIHDFLTYRCFPMFSATLNGISFNVRYFIKWQKRGSQVCRHVMYKHVLSFR